MKCKKCGNDFKVSYGFKNHCSTKCLYTRNLSDDAKRRISETLKGRKRNETRSKDVIRAAAEKQKKTWERKLLEEDFNSLGFDRMVKRVKLEQGGRCNKCEMIEWQGFQIPLELEHIDGDHDNNNRDNLEALCPNCHALTPTWRGRNKKNPGFGKKKVSDEDLMEAILRYNFNFRQALISVGLAAKGGNYNRCHKLSRIIKSQL